MTHAEAVIMSRPGVSVRLLELKTQKLHTQLALDVGQGFVVRAPDQGADLATSSMPELPNTKEQPSPEVPFRKQCDGTRNLVLLRATWSEG